MRLAALEHYLYNLTEFFHGRSRLLGIAATDAYYSWKALAPSTMPSTSERGFPPSPYAAHARQWAWRGALGLATSHTPVDAWSP